MPRREVSRIESGRSGIRQLDLRVLLDLYGIRDPAEREGWLSLAREARRQRWWRALEDQLPRDFLDLIGLEEDVSRCRGFQPSIVPGLFQTEAYATAVIQGGLAGSLTEEQKTKVQIRLERQKALTRSGPGPSGRLDGPGRGGATAVHRRSRRTAQSVCCYLPSWHSFRT